MSLAFSRSAIQPACRVGSACLPAEAGAVCVGCLVAAVINHASTGVARPRHGAAARGIGSWQDADGGRGWPHADLVSGREGKARNLGLLRLGGDHQLRARWQGRCRAGGEFVGILDDDVVLGPRFVGVDLRPDFQLDRPAMLAAIEREKQLIDKRRNIE